MHKYTAKFVEVEAIQLTPNTIDDIKPWLGNSFLCECEGLYSIMIDTHEGMQKVEPYDYIIKHAEDDFIKCSKYIFEIYYRRARK